jgi:uncharacterized protein YutE (UPF0331/DUF86 family)
VLVHDYVAVDWDIVYHHLHELDDLDTFADHIRAWLKEQEDIDG